MFLYSYFTKQEEITGCYLIYNRKKSRRNFIMTKNFKSLICCILALLFVSGTVIAVFADSTDLFAKVAEEVSTDVEVESDVAEEVVIRLGDVNFDGDITAADARLALRFSAQVQTPTAEEYIAANVIVDEAIKAADARLILRCSATLVDESAFGVAA